MRSIYKFIVFTLFLLCGVDAAADSLAAEPSCVITRFNCVIEKNGKLDCHEGHGDFPCISFFDVNGARTHSINALILAKMKELNLIDPGVNILQLGRFGVRLGTSVHESWTKITEKQVEAFWNSVSSEGIAVRDLNHLPLGTRRFADYVIKVSYHSPE